MPQVARFINAWSAEEVVYTRNASEAINLVAQTWGLANLQVGGWRAAAGRVGSLAGTWRRPSQWRLPAPGGSLQVGLQRR